MHPRQAEVYFYGGLYSIRRIERQVRGRIVTSDSKMPRGGSEACGSLQEIFIELRLKPSRDDPSSVGRALVDIVKNVMEDQVVTVLVLGHVFN